MIYDCLDPENVAHHAAEEFVRRADSAIQERGAFRVALAGGSTPKRTYELLAEPAMANRVNWSFVHLFFGDERSVAPDHPDSNFRTAHLALLSHVSIPTPQIHRMAGERGDLAQAARDYEAALAASFGVARDAGPPSFDLILLGMGKDGHTASLFPQTTALDPTKAWVVENDVPSQQTRRLTLTAPAINAARCVMFLVAGRDKAEPLVSVLEGPPNPREFPSQLIAPTDGELIWLVDRAASANLSIALKDPATLGAAS